MLLNPEELERLSNDVLDTLSDKLSSPVFAFTCFIEYLDGEGNRTFIQLANPGQTINDLVFHTSAMNQFAQFKLHELMNQAS